MIEQIVRLMDETDDRVRDNGGIFLAQPRRIRAKQIGLTRRGSPAVLITRSGIGQLPSAMFCLPLRAACTI
jgi:hypothetical protein